MAVGFSKQMQTVRSGDTDQGIMQPVQGGALWKRSSVREFEGRVS